MKILIVTKDGLALGLAQRLSLEGHQVEVFATDADMQYTGQGFYTISDNLWKSVQECKFIISDTGNQSQLCSKAATYNKPIIGCNKITDMINSDAIKEYDIGHRLGMEFPPSEIYDDAIGLQPLLLEGSKKHYYIKYGRKVFTCTKPEWLAWAMYNLPIDRQVLLQECAVGHDIAIIGWFNGLNWIKPFFYSTPNASKIGAVTLLSQRKSNRLTAKTIEPFGEFLKTVDYKGPVTVNLIVNKTQAYIKNIYIGLTAPCVFAVLEGLKDLPLADFLNSLAFGTSQSVNVTNDYIAGIEVQKADSDMHGAPILGINKDNLRHIFLHAVFTDYENAHRTHDGYMLSDEFDSVYTATAHGRDLAEVSQRVYRTISEVQFPNMKHVTNLQGQALTTFTKLRGWSII